MTSTRVAVVPAVQISGFSLLVGLVCCVLCGPVVAEPILARGGIRIRDVRAATKESGRLPETASASFVPLAGPVCYVALVITDRRLDEFEWEALQEPFGVVGQPLPGASANSTIAILDSGSSAHLVSYPDAVAQGLQGTLLSGNELPVQGVGGTLTLDIALPVGFFAHGAQDLSDGQPVPSLMSGQVNVAVGVNTAENHQATNDVPTVLGAPFFAHYGVVISNSRPVEVLIDGRPTATPTITFFSDPADPAVTPLVHKAFLQVLPAGSGTLVSYLGLPNDDFEVIPFTPSVIGLGSLFFTASALTLNENGHATAGKMMLDTAAQVTLISEIAAAELGLNLANPDFEVDVQGIGGVITAPGVFMDSLQLPALGGELVWSNVPVVVLSVASPEGGTLFGIFGANLLANRDYVLNTIAALPYLDVSDPVASWEPRITGLIVTGPDTQQLSWSSDLIAPSLIVEASEQLGGAMPWDPVATVEWPAVQGAIALTNTADQSFFRLRRE